MSKGFKINQRGVQEMIDGLTREIAKHPVPVPVVADTSGFVLPSATTVNNYHGPVVTVHGDRTQIAWDNQTATQSQGNTEQVVAPGYEDLARIITDLIAYLPTFALSDDDAADARASAETVLGEVVKADPDQSIVRRAVNMLKGTLSSVATGVSAAVTDESAQAAHSVIKALGEAMPF